MKVELSTITPWAGPRPTLGFEAPTKAQVLPKSKLAAFDVKVSAKGWAPAAGAHLCVVLDRRPCHRVDSPGAVKLSTLVPVEVLDEGQHVLSVALRHESGEFVRGPAAGAKGAPFATVSFFVGKKGPLSHPDGAPVLLFSPPEKASASRGVVLDYFVGPGELARGSLVVHASLGGPGMGPGIALSVDEWKPLRIENAREGQHLARLSLMRFAPDLGAPGSSVTVTYTAQPSPGPLSVVERSFDVTP